MVVSNRNMFKNADRLAYNKEPDHTAQSDLGLLCLIRSVNTKTLGDYGVNSQVHMGISTCIFLIHVILPA